VANHACRMHEDQLDHHVTQAHASIMQRCTREAALQLHCQRLKVLACTSQGCINPKCVLL
jgi:hypothetical protein